jgi:hypothetical protein
VFENRVLRRTVGPRRDGRMLHIENLHNLYPLPSIIKVKEDVRGRACSMNGEKRGGKDTRKAKT